jgi:xylulokinase
VQIGIDLGTSGVKAILVDAEDRLRAEAHAPLAVSRPRPLWSEQDPADWLAATEAAMDRLAAAAGAAMGAVEAIGLSGQMLGVALLDAADRPLRPALLWNDGRAAAECRELEALVPDIARRVGCRPMPGFGAPKMRWLMKHEAAAVARARRVLLPKDVVRLFLTGEAASDRADASATLFMETEAGVWSEEILAACGATPALMPRLVDSDEVAGALRPALAARWGLPLLTIVAGGAGDNMAGAVGAGVVAPGDAFISLGTSGVYFVANDRFVPALDRGMHTHRHAVRGLFAQHGVVLSAASALAWAAALVGASDIGRFLDEIAAADPDPAATPLFAPYLGGERTPHDDPGAQGVVAGLGFGTDRVVLGRAVLEGVAFALADCEDALRTAGAPIGVPKLIGGGARSLLWAEIVASVLGHPLAVPESAALGPAFGAARLARAAASGAPIAPSMRGAETLVAPRPRWQAIYFEKRARYQALYRIASSGGGA